MHHRRHPLVEVTVCWPALLHQSPHPAAVTQPRTWPTAVTRYSLALTWWPLHTRNTRHTVTHLRGEEDGGQGVNCGWSPGVGGVVWAWLGWWLCLCVVLVMVQWIGAIQTLDWYFWRLQCKCVANISVCEMWTMYVSIWHNTSYHPCRRVKNMYFILIECPGQPVFCPNSWVPDLIQAKCYSFYTFCRLDAK